MNVRSRDEADTRVARTLLELLPQLAGLGAAVARERGTVSPDRAKALWRLRLGPLRSGQLAQSCLLSRPAGTELIEALEAEGLVRREDDPTDRRAVLVSLTPPGRRDVQRFEAAFASAIGDIVAALSPAERERLSAALDDLRRALERAGRAKEGAGVR